MPTVASWLGYDPGHVRALPVAFQRALAAVSLSALPGIVLLGVSAGYGVAESTDSVPMAVSVGVAASVYLASLWRLNVAGGGVAAHQPARHASLWSPRAGPLMVLVLLAAFFSQPLILWWLADEQESELREFVSALSSMHERAVLGPVQVALNEATSAQTIALRRRDLLVVKLEAERAELERVERGGDAAVGRMAAGAIQDDTDALLRAERDVEDTGRRVAAWAAMERQISTEDVLVYRAHLERSHFLVRRVQLTWARPLWPAVGSVLLMLVLVLPWFVAATTAKASHRAYELRRWAATRALIEVAYAQARELEADALRAFPDFTGLRRELFSDPPYNTVPVRSRSLFEARHG